MRAQLARSDLEPRGPLSLSLRPRQGARGRRRVRRVVRALPRRQHACGARSVTTTRSASATTSRAAAAFFTPAVLRAHAPASGAPARRSDLHRRPAARRLDADRADPVEPLAGRGHDGAARTYPRSRRRSVRSAAGADKLRYPQRAAGAAARTAARARRGVPGPHTHPAQERPAVLHRQAAEQLPARRLHPSDAAQRAHHRRAAPPPRLLFFGVQAALRPRPELHLRPGGARSLLPLLRAS